VIDAEPGSTIGIGLRQSLTSDPLPKAALDGSIVDLMEWRTVTAGDFFYVPPRTVHAIGGGISLLEFQQNSDVTYRLYDYGRPRGAPPRGCGGRRESGRIPKAAIPACRAREDRLLVDGPEFIFVHAHSDALQGRRRWILPLDGEVNCGAGAATAGQCLLVEAGDGARRQMHGYLSPQLIRNRSLRPSRCS
jgi:mannose-6-phosphate isomerase